MSFHGKIAEPEAIGPMKTFRYWTAVAHQVQQVEAHELYFYESGHIGFWETLPDDDRRLVLAVKADKVQEL